MQGILPRAVITHPSGNLDEIRELWSNLTENQLVRIIESYLEQPPHPNFFTTKKEVVATQNTDYLMVLRKLVENLGKQQI